MIDNLEPLAMHIDWRDHSTTHVMINPRFNEEQKQLTYCQLKEVGLLGHIWVATSGTSTSSSEEQKWAAISKEAFLKSAEAVNKHLESDDKDVWLHCLPDYHVGGLGIWARAAISGAAVVDLKQIHGEKWCSHHFHQQAFLSKTTLTSMVPTQLYDLVHNNMRAPPTLRASIIGGGALNAELYLKAKMLGWNPLPSYGLTECSSQVATAPLESLEPNVTTPQLKILPHVKLSINSEKKLLISSPSLLTTYSWVGKQGLKISNEIKNGWFQTEDLAEIKNNHLILHGRGSDFIKIGGESVDIQRLNLLLEQLASQLHFKADAVLVPIPDHRLGHVLFLAAAKTQDAQLASLIENYHKSTLPFERIRQIVKLNSIPRTDLGKVKRQELIELIKNELS
jgi:O-succinylbenzoic acid--CoA ligase